MKILLFFGCVILILYLIFKIIYDDWASSDNSIKSSIGCTVMALLIGGGILLTLLGSIKSCADSSSPSYDYYDYSPRK